MAPWTVSYLENLDAIMTVYSGALSPEMLQNAVQETIIYAQQRGTWRLLADCSTLEGGHSIVDLYEISKLLEKAGVASTFYEAIVLPQLNAIASDVHFYETICRNRGFDVRVFKTTEDATAWLAEIRSSDSNTT